LHSKFFDVFKKNIHYKTLEEIELIRESALIVSKTLGMLAKEIKPGVLPIDLDRKAEEFIRDMGAIPGFLGLYDFPNTLCVSINEEVVHGIPKAKPLQSGDIISVDCGALKNEFYGDQAYTFEVGEVSEEVKKLCRITKESLYVGIEKARVGNKTGDIGNAIQRYTQKEGYGVVRELSGHGLGRSVHEEPQVDNYGKKGSGVKLLNGMVIAIEPMINMGTRRVKQLNDGWTFVTSDKKPSAHFEHDVAIVDGKPEILSSFDYVEEALGLPKTTPKPRKLI